MSSTLNRIDWNAELVRGDREKAVRQLKREPGKRENVAIVVGCDEVVENR